MSDFNDNAPKQEGLDPANQPMDFPPIDEETAPAEAAPVEAAENAQQTAFFPPIDEASEEASAPAKEEAETSIPSDALPPNPAPPYPDDMPLGEGWICGTPMYMMEEAKRRARYRLKRTIKSETNAAIGLVLLFVVGMQILASAAVLIYEAITTVTGYGFTEPVYNFVFSYFPVILCESLALIIGLFWFKTDVKQLFRKPTLQKGERYKGVLYTGFSLGMIQCGALIYVGIYYLLYALGIEIYVPQITADTSNILVNILSFAYIVVFGPLLEEIFFRGIVFQKLRKYGDIPTIIITALLFALFHCNFVQLLGPFFFGIAIGIVAARTNSLWLCWLIHSINNLIATVYEYLPESAAEIYDWSVTVGLVVVGVICAILLGKELKTFMKNRRGNCTVLSAKAKFGCMVNNACFYIFAVIWLGLSLLVQFSGSLM